MAKSMDNLHLFCGPPGTGKTTTLCRSAEKNAALFGAERICACSYTRAAAAVFGSHDFPLPVQNMGTLHSFAFRALDKPELVIGEEKEFNTLHPEFRLSTGAGSVDEPLNDPGGVTLGDRLLAKMEILRAQMEPVETWRPDVRNFSAAWDAWKEAAGLYDFTDLLSVCLRDITNMPGDPAVIYYDEAQDATRLQMSLVCKWAGEAQKLILAGDPAQTLFAWAGASPDCMTDLSIPPERFCLLGQSYRLPRLIHEHAEKWLLRWHPTKFPDRTYKPREEPGILAHSNADWTKAEQLVDMACKRAAAGKSVMILGSCRQFIQPTLAVLRKRGIPFHNPYRHAETAWNPLRRGYIDRSKRRVCTAADRLLAFLPASGETWTKDAVWLWMSVLEAKGRLRKGAKESLKKFKGDFTAYDCLWDFLEPDFLSKVMFLAFDNPDEIKASLCIWREAMLAKNRQALEYVCRVAELHGRQAVVNEPLIQIGTIHSVKGGEASTVILLPDMSRAAYDEWLSHHSLRGPMIRTMYVGMTRAREELILCNARTPQAVCWAA